jgi:calcineurin-like phosphoesterase family protein
MKSKTPTSTAPAQLGIAERYFAFLLSTYETESGKRAQYAATKFIDTLRALEYDRTWSGSHVVSNQVSAHLSAGGVVWFFSDLHLGHITLLKYRGYPNTGSTEEIDKRMLTGCQETVRPDDMFILGGDIAMGDLRLANDFLHAIRCHKKIVVLGNHDVDRDGKVLRLHADEVVTHLDLAVAGQRVLVTHYPVPKSLLDALAPSALNVHGHIHGMRCRRSWAMVEGT